jgi:hypothetical protein
VSASDEAAVSWKGIDRDAAVVAADGQEIGRVTEIAGDEEADIFDGLVVAPRAGGPPRYVGAERVGRVSPDRVETDLSAEEAVSLPEYKEPVSVTWRADEGRGFGARLRAAFKDLFGRSR